ncbi:uncharacterized protein CTRU02_215813 [Colletotrichum truncatum]|uniref:Uncharacterized protein n=1 Tax=Colletotrichum truncatum TaxID=5467 RepID=A0ACC3YBQ9_COLTU
MNQNLNLDSIFLWLANISPQGDLLSSSSGAASASHQQDLDQDLDQDLKRPRKRPRLALSIDDDSRFTRIENEIVPRKNPRTQETRHLPSPTETYLPVSHHEPIPSSHDMTHPHTPSPQKRALDDTTTDVGYDLDYTPRPFSLTGVTFSPRPSDQSSVSGQSVTSRASGASSPNKRLRDNEILDSGFTLGQFSEDPDLPSSLRTLIDKLGVIEDGFHLLPTSRMSDVDPVTKPKRGASIPRHAFGAEGDFATAYKSRVPSLDWMQEVKSDANKCERERSSESQWNAEIHLPVLKWICKKASITPGLLGTQYCTTAQILSNYRPKGAPTQMVDFCIVVDPARDMQTPEARGIISRKCSSRPGSSINHSDMGGLTHLPIALSLETKRPGVEWDKALLQVGTWQTAQFRSLKQLGWDPEASAIEFLPAVIVQGHDWDFVATVPGLAGDQSVIYLKVPMGSTRHEWGILKLVLALQCVTQWCEGVFWPAFKRECLGCLVRTV